MKGKANQYPLQNAGIPTGILGGCKTSRFFTALFLVRFSFPFRLTDIVLSEEDLSKILFPKDISFSPKL